MKNLKVTTTILAITFVSLTSMSCKDETKKTDAEESIHNMEMGHPDDGSQNHASMNQDSNGQDTNLNTQYQKNPTTSPIIDAYLQIKNALVGDSKDKAVTGATALLAAFSAFDMTKLNEDTHTKYMEILESAKEHSEHIVKSPIEHQREHFESLSTDIDDMIALLGTEKTLYQDYCPMKKASWISETKDIKNPYFGSEMLTCGSVKKEIN